MAYQLNDFDKARLEANREILLLLAMIVERYPQLRFGQIIDTYGFFNGNMFTEEPQVTLKRIKADLKKYGIDV